VAFEVAFASEWALSLGLGLDIDCSITINVPFFVLTMSELAILASLT
jgi:hypothetical protein